MASKTISLKEGTYSRLARAKGDGESFSDAIDRLLEHSETDHPLYELVGLGDAAGLDELPNRSRAFRADIEDRIGGIFVILDATFLIDLIAEDEGAVAKLHEIDDELLVVPTLAYTEVGVGITPNTPAAKRFESVMEQVTVVPYDAEAARRAVDIQRQLYSQGNPIGAVDGMIAGTALARDAAVVTRNVEEFARTPVRVSPY